MVRQISEITWVAEQCANNPAPSWGFSDRAIGALGKAISVKEFLGRVYDFDRRALVDPGNSRTLDNDMGFAYAFAFPPYGLYDNAHQRRPSFDEKTALINRVIEALFASFRGEPEIYGWSNDWSNYFNDGHEWWGAYLWTVRPSERNWIIGVAASSTD